MLEPHSNLLSALALRKLFAFYAYVEADLPPL
jgi:hypothetical protein